MFVLLIKFIVYRDKPKDRPSSKIKKKVRFNLNVKTYEPIPNDETADYFSESCEKETWDKNEEETEKSTISSKNCEGNSIGSGMVSYPSNYRYQNFSDSYDEEDEIRLEESDLDDDEFSDTDEEDGCDSNDEEDNGWKTRELEFIEQFYTQNKGSNEKKVSNAELAVEKSNNLVLLHALPVQELKKFEGNNNARDRSLYVHSVLNPVENLSQWKAIKARSKPPLKRQKENITTNEEQQRPLNLKPSFNPLLSGSRSNLENSKPLMQEMAVDASLTNWLLSPNNKRLNSPSTRKGNVINISNSQV